jgi:hypothetical protein
MVRVACSKADTAALVSARDIGFERLDDAKADADVAPSAQALAGIEHVAAFDHKVELVVRTHGGVRPTLSHGSECKRTGGGKKLAARGEHRFSSPARSDFLIVRRASSRVNSKRP